jgi:hypothetical protein
MLYIRYGYATYTIELTVDRIDAGLGGSSLRLAYIYSLRRTLLAPTRVILDRYCWGCIRLAYAIDIRRLVYLRLAPVTAAAARALSIISICLIYAFSITNLVSPSRG